MAGNNKHQPKGTTKGGKKVGGQFAPQRLAVQPDDNNMALNSTMLTIDDDDWWDDREETEIPESSVSITDKVYSIWELEAALTHEEYAIVAKSQTDIADTLAEMWHAQSTSYAFETRRLMCGNKRDHYATDKSLALAEKMQESILRTNHKEPYVVFRGMSDTIGGYVTQLKDKLEVGSTFQASGFLSTSVDPKIATKFMSRYRDTDQLMFRIETSVGKFLPSSSMEDTTFYSENEVVLPHGATFDVLSVEDIPWGSGANPENTCTVVSLKYTGVAKGTEDLSDVKSMALQQPASRQSQHLEQDLEKELDKWMGSYQVSQLPKGKMTTEFIDL